MVTEQASEHNLSNLSGARSDVSAERLLNLLELSNSDLTASTGMEDLPVTEMLLDTLLGVLQSERPDLLTHSQRVAFLCYGMGRQFGWSAKRTNTLVTAALLHDLGKLASSSQCSFWDETAAEEELSRYVTIDLLETCHADSDLLEILSQSLHFGYREEPPQESDCPTPDHVLFGAAAFQFAHLFEKVRHQRGGTHHLSEIVAALQHCAEIPIEEQVVAALEEWLAGRDKIIHSFDPSMFFPSNQDMDEDTAAFVRATFVEILEELYNLQKNYDAFFILDSTGRFQLWNSGCQLHHGYTIREMRNKHWHNSLIGYCNHEGLAFSDAQTPLFQTLESGKPARTTLFLKKGEHNLVEAEVASIPIMGRDKLMLGIVELHRISGAQDQSPPDILYTPEWISELAGELRRLVQQEPEGHAIPELDDELILIIESRLGIAPDLSAAAAAVTAPQTESQEEEDSSSSIDLDEGEVEADLQAAIQLDPEDSDILTEDEVAKANAPEPEDLELAESETALGSVESDTVASEEPEGSGSLESDTSLSPEDETAAESSDATADFVLEEESSDEEELPELGSHLDDLLSRFDDMVTETIELEETEDEQAASAELESAPTTELPVDESHDEPQVASTEVEFEEADLETTDSIAPQADAERAEHEQSVDEEGLEEVAGSATDSGPSEHVLESSLELGEALEVAEISADEGTEDALGEDDVLSFLMEDSSVGAEEPPASVETADEPDEEILEESAGAAETEESSTEELSPSEEPEDLEALETTDAASVLQSEDQADFDLDVDVEVSDSELLQALQDEELAVEKESADTTVTAESSTESPVAEQVEEATAEPEAPQIEEAAEEPAAKQAEVVAEERAAEQAEEASEEPIAKEVEEAVEEPAAEPVEEVVEEPAAEEVEEVEAEPVAEPVEGFSEELVAERAKEVAEELVTEEVAQEVTEEPAAEPVEKVSEERVVEQAEEIAEEPVAEEVAQEVAKEPADEQAEEAAGESGTRQVEEVAEAAEPEAVEEVSEEPVAEQPEDAAAESVAEEKPAAEAEPEPEQAAKEEPKEFEEPEPVPVAATHRKESRQPPAPPLDSDLQSAPVSRTEWDAFVSYLLDPDSADHEQVAVLFLDLDRFKAINEGFGRQIGDDLLKEISRRLSEACGTRELSCRYGGGQFAISCPGLTLEKASKRGDQIRKLIERTRFDVLPFQALTVSIGVASSEEGDTLNGLMNRAEHSLYNAKSSGRNCVVAMSSEQIEAELAQEEEAISSVATDKPFEVVAEFEAMIASDMIVYKLGGFLYDMHAKLLHVDKRHVAMRVGSKGFLPYWGRQDDARPVLIDLELGEGWGGQKEGQKPSKSSIIHIRIRPDGWVRNQETFYKRAQHVLRELKGYFAGS
jgi:diguanylate cyclase (GGDEF)-like protein